MTELTDVAVLSPVEDGPPATPGVEEMEMEMEQEEGGGGGDDDGGGGGGQGLTPSQRDVLERCLHALTHAKNDSHTLAALLLVGDSVYSLLLVIENKQEICILISHFLDKGIQYTGY